MADWGIRSTCRALGVAIAGCLQSRLGFDERNTSQKRVINVKTDEYNFQIFGSWWATVLFQLR